MPMLVSHVALSRVTHPGNNFRVMGSNYHYRQLGNSLLFSHITVVTKTINSLAKYVVVLHSVVTLNKFHSMTIKSILLNSCTNKTSELILFTWQSRRNRRWLRRCQEKQQNHASELESSWCKLHPHVSPWGVHPSRDDKRMESSKEQDKPVSTVRFQNIMLMFQIRLHYPVVDMHTR